MTVSRTARKTGINLNVRLFMSEKHLKNFGVAPIRRLYPERNATKHKLTRHHSCKCSGMVPFSFACTPFLSGLDRGTHTYAHKNPAEWRVETAIEAAWAGLSPSLGMSKDTFREAHRPSQGAAGKPGHRVAKAQKPQGSGAGRTWPCASKNASNNGCGRRGI